MTAACVVIIFDQDFNPHNDRQAADRAYRIGQKRDVDIVKLITKGTVEEDMLRLGQTKLALDEAVAGDDEAGEGSESKAAQIMRKSLMETLRKKFENDEDDDDVKMNVDPPPPTDIEDTTPEPKQPKPPASLEPIVIDDESDLTDIDD